jgi:hypothetical protein
VIRTRRRKKENIMENHTDEGQKTNRGAVTNRLRLGLHGGLLFGEGWFNRIALEQTAAGRAKMVDGVGDSACEWQTLSTGMLRGE